MKSIERNKPSDIDKYILGFPKDTQKLLEQLRATIRKAAPKAEEVISYQMPAYKYFGMLVFFAGYKHHIGFYPGAGGIENFKKEIAKYKWAKGSVQFPIDKTLPIGLITKIVKFRVKQNMEKSEAKRQDGFLSLLSAPAKRALENKGIKTLKKLSSFSESEILGLHGMGPGSMPKLRSILKSAGLRFKK